MLMTALDQGLAAVDEVLERVIATEVDVLQETSRHIIASGGKRLRPRLLILAYQAAGGREIQEVIPLAAAVELVHTATLVHDDINDHSPTRRGRVAVHARWGRTFALLTGDYLFTKVYELMAPFDAQINVIMARACVKLVEGETLQAAAAKSGVINRETYREIIALKTASLFEAAARMGAYHAGANDTTVDALADYAHYLGLTFQIVDDVLDIVGDPETMGKPAGSDLVHGSGVTMVQNGKKITASSPVGAAEADPIREMIDQLRDSGAVDVALAQANALSQKAIKSLERVPESAARTELAGLVSLVLDRER